MIFFVDACLSVGKKDFGKDLCRCFVHYRLRFLLHTSNVVTSIWAQRVQCTKRTKKSFKKTLAQSLQDEEELASATKKPSHINMSADSIHSRRTMSVKLHNIADATTKSEKTNRELRDWDGKEELCAWHRRKRELALCLHSVHQSKVEVFSNRIRG